MSQLMLVNPKRKRRAAPRKMTAKQAKYFAPRKRRVTRRRKARVTTVRARRNPIARARRVTRRRRSVKSFLGNSSGSLSIKGLAIPSAMGAAGAIGLDIAYGYLPIPANLKTGTFAPLVKLAAVIGICMAAQKFLPRQREFVKNAARAAVTIASYNFLKAQAQQIFPTVPLGEYISGVGEYIPGNFPQLGYISPAQQTGDLSGNMPWGNPEFQDQIF